MKILSIAPWFRNFVHADILEKIKNKKKNKKRSLRLGTTVMETKGLRVLAI